MLRSSIGRIPYIKEALYGRHQLRLEIDRLRRERSQIRQKIRQIEADSDRLRTELDRVTTERDSMYLGWPPGHFYSPIPSIEQIRAKEAAIFRIPSQIPAINLNVEGQLALFDAIKQYYAEQPFANHKQERVRYFFVNPNF